MRSRAQGTVREYAEELLTRISFVDLYGRPVGLDYETIVKMLRKKFPKSRVSVRVLQDWYAYTMQQADIRMPVRRRSRRILARDYTRVLVLQHPTLSFNSIRQRVRHKYPEIKPLSLPHVCGSLGARGMRERP